MKWYRYRTRWSSRIVEWEYEYIGDWANDEFMEDFLSEKMESYKWWDSYRGYDWEWANPAKEIIQMHLDQAERDLISQEKIVSALRSALEECKN